MNLLLYSLGLIFAQIISKEPILAGSVDTSVKPNDEEKQKFISTQNFKEPISDDELLDALFLNIKSKFGTENDEDGDGKSNFKLGKVIVVNEETNQSEQNKYDEELLNENAEENQEEIKQGEDDQSTESVNEISNENKEQLDSGIDPEKTETLKNADDGEDSQNQEKNTNNEEQDQQTTATEEINQNEVNTRLLKGNKNLKPRKLFSLFKRDPHEHIITPNHPDEDIEQSIEINQNGDIIWDPEEIKIMKELSEVDYEKVKSDKEVKEEHADEAEKEYTSTPKQEDEETEVSIHVDDNIYNEENQEKREQLDKLGFKSGEYEVPPKFFSDLSVKRKYCRKNPDFELCQGPGIVQITIDYIVAFASSILLFMYILIFAALCFFFFFRIKIYYNELSNAISNGYMEFYEKQNPIMVITSLEREKLENINFQFFNAKRAEKKKGLFASLFSRNKSKSKIEAKDQEKEKIKGDPKTNYDVLNTFDGRQYEINNKNLSPVIVTFDIMNKDFESLSNYIVETIEQDIIYYEVEIEMLLGSTEIILGKKESEILMKKDSSTSKINQKRV
jgi:hypothetical protein